MSKPFRTLEGLFRLDNFMFPAFDTLVIVPSRQGGTLVRSDHY